jgi:hypothetical protein
MSMQKTTSRWRRLIDKIQEAKELLPDAPRFGSPEYLRYRKFLGSMITNNDCSRATEIQFNKLNPHSDPETFKNWGNAIRSLRDSLDHLRDGSLKNIGAIEYSELQYTTQQITFALGQLEERFPFLYTEIAFDCLLSLEERETWRNDNLLLIQLIEDEFNLLETHEAITLPSMANEIPDQEKSITLNDQFLYLQQEGRKTDRGLWFRLSMEEIAFKRLLLEPAEMRIIHFLYDMRFSDRFALKREEISEQLLISSKSVGTRIAKVREKCKGVGMPTDLIIPGPSPATWMLDNALDCCSKKKRKTSRKTWGKLNFGSTDLK